MKTILIGAGILFVVFICFRLRKKSRRTFTANLLKQVVYLIPRYFV